MFSKFDNKIDTIFLDIESNNFNTTDKVNIILSPSLYWVKKIKLPVKSVREVKPLLKSIFEDILPDGVYSYDVYKSYDDFFVFAYEDKKILELIEQKGLNPSQVNHIYFAQSELANISGAMKINKTQSIYVKDGIVVLLPCCWIKESGQLHLGDLKLSKNHIDIKQYNHIVDEKTLYTLLGVSMLFTFLVLFEYIITVKNVDKITKMKDEVFQTYSLKPTMMQNKSMLKQYEKINTKQTNLRTYIASVLSLKLPTDVTLTLLKSNSKKLTALFNGVDKKAYSSIKKQFKDKHIDLSTSLKNDTLSVEFKL